MADLIFAKGQALGNDYLVVDAADLDRELSPALIRGICDRHRGAGSDGILVGRIDVRPVELRIYNPDGTEAEKSGNGLRIFAAYLHGRGIVADERFPVRLVKDQVELQVVGQLESGALDIVADMGVAAFTGQAIGRPELGGEIQDCELELDEAEPTIAYPLSLSNPHCVVLVDSLERDDFLRRAPRVCTHPFFPAGTNVQFARVSGPASLEAWIWERGAGETLASGSSACAVGAVAVRLGLVRERALRIDMVGGSVSVSVAPDFSVRLRGEARMVYHGKVLEAAVKDWEEGQGQGNGNGLD